jgi:hypothetical protein
MPPRRRSLCNFNRDPRPEENGEEELPPPPPRPPYNDGIHPASVQFIADATRHLTEAISRIPRPNERAEPIGWNSIARNFLRALGKKCLLYSTLNISHVITVSSPSSTFLAFHHLPASPVSCSAMYRTFCSFVQPRVLNNTSMPASHASAAFGPSVPSKVRK